MNNSLDTQPTQRADEPQPHNPREFSKKASGITNTGQPFPKREKVAWELLDSMADLVIFVDLQGNILWANQTASMRFDKSPGLLGGVSIWEVYPSQKTTHYMTLFNKVIKTGQSLNFIDKDDGRWVEFSIYPINFSNGEPEEIVFLEHDITAQIDAEEALKRVTLQLISAQEDERHRISQELHDEIGQQMTALLLELHSVQAALRKEHIPFADNIEELIRDLEAIMKRLRQVFYQLSPPFLDNTALIKVLRAHCSSFTKSTGIPIDISCPEDFPTLSNIYEVTLYRFVQEGLTNAAKHGKASAVWINLDASGNEINVSLEDDGLGFDAMSASPGLGLKGIQERFMMLRGSFEIESTPGKGTKLFGSLPNIPDES